MSVPARSCPYVRVRKFVRARVCLYMYVRARTLAQVARANCSRKTSCNHSDKLAKLLAQASRKPCANLSRTPRARTVVAQASRKQTLAHVRGRTCLCQKKHKFFTLSSHIQLTGLGVFLCHFQSYCTLRGRGIYQGICEDLEYIEVLVRSWNISRYKPRYTASLAKRAP